MADRHPTTRERAAISIPGAVALVCILGSSLIPQELLALRLVVLSGFLVGAIVTLVMLIRLYRNRLFP